MRRWGGGNRQDGGAGRGIVARVPGVRIRRPQPAHVVGTQGAGVGTRGAGGSLDPVVVDRPSYCGNVAVGRAALPGTQGGLRPVDARAPGHPVIRGAPDAVPGHRNSIRIGAIRGRHASRRRQDAQESAVQVDALAGLHLARESGDGVATGIEAADKGEILLVRELRLENRQAAGHQGGSHGGAIQRGVRGVAAVVG